MATEIVSVSLEELPDEIQETLSAIGAHENVEHIIKAEPGNDFIVTVDPCEDANDYFVIEEYEEPSEPIQHPSVGTTKEEFMSKLRGSSQCFLCTDPISQSKARIEQHFVRVHLDHGMNLAGKLVVVCRLGCKKDGHYHCPHAECLFSCKNQPRLRLHYRLNHEPCSDSDAIFLLQEEENKAASQAGRAIKQEPNDYEDALVGPDSDHILTEIYGGEDEMADVHPAKMSETLQGVSDMYKHSMDAEGKVSFMQLLKQPSEKPSIAHSRDELLARLAPPRCFLCPDLVISPRSRLLRHFTSLHMNHSIKVANFFVAACKLECSRFTLSHYHCPYPNCLATVKVKARLVGHFKKHLDYIRSGHKLDNPEPNESQAELVQVIPHQFYPKKIKKSLFLNEEVEFPSPKKIFEFHGVPCKSHPSFGASAAELFERLCLPFCYLCYDRKQHMRMPRLERHFRMAHLNRAVDCGSVYLVQCGLDCMGAEPGRKHYHCPYCPLKDCRRCAFWIHLEMHRREGHVAEHLKKIRPHMNGTIKTQEIGTPSGPITISFSHNFDNETIVTTEIPVSPTKPWNEMYRGLPVKKRPGIHTSKEEVLALARLPNCYLCNSDKDYICQRRLVAHITRCHLKLFFALDQFVVLLCKLWCGDKLQDKGHYHCLFCDYVAAQKNRVKKHVMKHVRNVQKKADTAEFHLPEVMEDQSVPEDWLSPDNRDEVRQWEHNFNDYLTNTYVKNAKTNNNILTEKKKYVVYNHTRFSYEIEERSLKYWVRFRSVKVISCEQLGLKNVLVMPLTKYNTDSENRAINVQQEPHMEDFELVLNGDDPEKEFLLCYRIIPTLEEMFKLLYELHVIKSNHPSAKTMFGEIRRKYLYFPRAVVDKYVMLCPTCGVHLPDKSNDLPPVITLKNADSINLAALQVTVVDMSEHPDGKYSYVVECFDRCSRLTWLIPAERTVPADLAESITRYVLAVIGLPGLLLTNCGEDFLEKMLQEIDRRWYGSCADFIRLSREAACVMVNHCSDELMESLQELVCTQPLSWASVLPHLQFRMNHTRGHQPQEQSAYEQVFGRQRSRPNWQHFLTNTNTSTPPAVRSPARRTAPHDDDGNDNDDDEDEGCE